MKDIITGLNGKKNVIRDLSSSWDRAFNLGRADAGEDFLINGYLGNTNSKGFYDSVDRLKFNVKDNLHFELKTDPNTITELVKFDSQGTATVVADIEYGNFLSANLTTGNYGLSFFVEGDLIDYQVNAQFL
jgi:hypothetical protein